MKHPPEIGKTYKVTVGKDVMPTLWRLEEIVPLHCSLHGERYGTGYVMRKRRNSEKRPWGTLGNFDASSTTLELVE